jgi:large subunit ribosomal protein L22
LLGTAEFGTKTWEKLRSKVVHAKRIERKHGGDKAPTSKLVIRRHFGASLRGSHRAAESLPDRFAGRACIVRGNRAIPASARHYIDRVLLSAIGNADVKSEGSVSAENLFVRECYVDEGPRLKRFLAGPMGRARPILRRMCHITVVVGEMEKAEKE